MTRERDRSNLSRDSEDNSVNNDNNYSITNEQIAQSDELTQRWKRINKRRSYTEKALFRANQENLVKKFGDSKNNENVSVEEIKSVLEGCNDTFEKIQLRGASGREMVQDAKILTGLANNLITQTQKNLAANSRYFRLGNFVRHLHNTLLQNKSKPIFTKGNPLLKVDEKIESDIKLEKETSDDVPTLTKSDWKRIAKFADVVPRPRSLSYILAIFSENMAPGEKKIKKARGKREAKEQAVVLSQRDKIDHTKNEASISKELEHVKECLRIALRNGNGVVSYFAFVIDPKSFGKTVENIFHTSFLIKDFYAQLDLNEKGLLEISELDDVKREVLRRKADESSNQAVMKFDHSIWSAMIETLEITNAMIPQRKIELE